jgi:hypothetical protein
VRLSALIAQAKKAGAREIELHPDGSIARLVFGDPEPVVKPRREKTKQELIAEDQAARNPKRDALDVALEVMGRG